MNKIRKTIYLTEDNDFKQEQLRRALDEEGWLPYGGLSDASWFRIIIESGLRSLAEEVREFRKV